MHNAAWLFPGTAHEKVGRVQAQVLAQAPLLLFLGGPPADASWALQRHTALITSG